MAAASSVSNVSMTERPDASYVGSIDQGTTSTRFILFDRKGQIVQSAQEEHTQHTTAGGHVEHDALEILARTLEVVATCMGKAKAKASDLAAIGITNQRETTLVWDPKTGHPLTRAVVWMDTRASSICKKLSNELGGRDALAARTGLPIVPYFSGPKLKWLLDHTEGLRAKAEAGQAVFGTIDSWLAWCLTGGPGRGRHLTDVTNASRTLMLDLDSMQWAEDLCAHFGVPPRMLPEVVSSSQVYAECAVWAGPGDRQGPGEAADLLAGVPLAGILGDQQAALFGQACFRPGQTKNTYGTGCFMLRNTGTRRVQSSHGLLTTVAFKIGDEAPVFGLEGSVSQAGSVVQWMRDNLRLFERSSDVQALAEEVEDSGGVYFVPAFSGLFAPRWRDDARGLVVGLTKGSRRGHLCRAALEATCFQSRELAVAMAKDVEEDRAGGEEGGGEDAGEGALDLTMRVDGGMVVNDALLQTQADIMGSSVQRPAVVETTALGAAYAAGLAVGFWSSMDELQEQWALDREFKPRMGARERDGRVRDWERAVHRSLGWAKEEGSEEGAEGGGGCEEDGAIGTSGSPTDAGRALTLPGSVLSALLGAVVGAAAVYMLGGFLTGSGARPASSGDLGAPK